MPIDTKILNIHNNCMSLPPYYNYNRYGVCNIDTFKQRLNIFATGCKDIDIFAGVPWDNFAITGSVIPACLQNNSPLIDLFNNHVDNEHTMFNNFVNTYYNNSDIDIMCNEKTLMDFILKVDIFTDILMKNTKCYYPDCEYETTPVTSACVFVSQTYINNKIKDIVLYDALATTDNVLNAINAPVTLSPGIKQYFYDIYVKQKQDKGIKRVNQVPINELRFKVIDYKSTKKINSSDCIVSEYISNYNKEVRQYDDHLIFKICENVRYKVKISCFDRPFEIFNVRGDDFFTVVAKFHYSCVRAYYQGTDVYILPECVTAMMTSIVIPFNCYFAGARHPAVIHNKYVGRGFSIVANSSDKKRIHNYNDKTECFPADKCFGVKDINDDIYNPFLDKTRANSQIQPKYISEFADFKNIYKTECNYSNEHTLLDLYKCNALKSDGNANMYRPEIAKLFYTLIN